MTRAAVAPGRHCWIVAAQVDLLTAAVGRPDRTCTADDIFTGDATAERPAGGKWVGSVPSQLARAGFLIPAGHRKSFRPKRHAGLVTVWRLAVTDAVALTYRDRLLNELSTLATDTPTIGEGV